MNKSLRKIDIEDVLFFDAEMVRLSEKLEIGSREYFNYQKKTRDMKTDVVLDDLELVEMYRNRAALRMTFNKIVTVGVGYVYNGQLRIKAITGTEWEILEAFCGITTKFKYICGFNIIQFDLPMIVANGMKYFDVVGALPDMFNTSGKKPWEMKNIVDLFDQFKGTHFGNSSFDEVCRHFDVPSPKDDIDGSMVSEVYYTEGVDRIASYVKKDVFASVQLFQRMRYEEMFTEFVDANEEKIEVVIEEIPPLEKLYSSNEFSKEVIDKILALKGKKKLTKKDKSNLFTILRGVYVRTDFVHMDQDSKKVIAAKEEEINEFIENIL